MGQGRALPEGCRKEARHTRPGELPLANPTSSDVAQALSNTCLGSRISTKLRPILASHGLVVAFVGQTLPKPTGFCQFAPTCKARPHTSRTRAQFRLPEHLSGNLWATFGAISGLSGPTASKFMGCGRAERDLVPCPRLHDCRRQRLVTGMKAAREVGSVGDTRAGRHMPHCANGGGGDSALHGRGAFDAEVSRPGADPADRPGTSNTGLESQAMRARARTAGANSTP